MRFRLFTAAACLIAISCGDDGGPGRNMEGTYVLSSKDNDPIPFPASCSAHIVESGRVVLEPRNQGSYELLYRAQQNDSVFSYTSSGLYNQSGNVLRLMVTGRWSHHSQSATTRFDFEVIEDGSALALHNVGAECDGSDIEIYRRMEPLQ
jgi:hypothetical protein